MTMRHRRGPGAGTTSSGGPTATASHADANTTEESPPPQSAQPPLRATQNPLPSLQSGNAPSAAASPSTSLQLRAPRLEGINNSIYYMPQFMWLHAMDSIPYSCSHLFVSALPPHHEFMLSRIRDLYIRPYNPSKAEDVELLGRLWNGHNRIVFAPETLKFSPAAHCVTEGWKELGFQGTDPSTDFRGAGLFGLTQLVYLVERHPEQWNTMLTRDFLTAAAGINVTMRLMTLLGVNATVNQFSSSMHSTYSACEGRLQLCRFIFDQNTEVAVQRLNEVYCFAMRLLHYRWMRSSRNLMEFNQQLSAMYVELERLLFVSKSVEELCAIL